MINTFLSVVLATSSFLLFTFTYRINGLNRTIVSSPIKLLECAVPLTVQEEEIVLFYDKELLIEKYDEYLENNITKFTDSYEVNYYFYNTKDGGVCDINNCQGVEINIDAKVMLGISYHRVMKYEIVEGKLHG